MNPIFAWAKFRAIMPTATASREARSLMLLSRVGRTQLPLPRGIKFIDAIALQAATRVDCHDSSPAGLTAMKDLSTCRVVCASCDRLPALTNRHVLHRDFRSPVR